MSTRIVVLAKAPLAGHAKTRLIPALGALGAAELAERMLHHTLAEAAAADIGPVELCVTPDPTHSCWQGFPEWADLTAQGEGDLGDRMARASRRALSTCDRVMLIGTDCPSLTRERLNAASRALHHAQAVMIPASDGGYVLLGLTAFDPTLFTDMPWSTDQVADLTRQRIRALGWTMYELDTLYDIDEPEDLNYLPLFLQQE
ncbi:Glycosyltransferase [Marinobacterium lacunae]|uniref:Glycosyltransferase n=1 Tax=Marinobacterium lacunae TaxID=1232683 RepID=A0A081FWB3_9GAMM|nr:TIGR04282 family arsenosugar biosynthesis glycosyltransferase [Marinobacterium lacunae]KEA62818.1 Glycosyltransferase [Marinobacterium lacunae]